MKATKACREEHNLMMNNTARRGGIVVFCFTRGESSYHESSLPFLAASPLRKVGEKMVHAVVICGVFRGDAVRDVQGRCCRWFGCFLWCVRWLFFIVRAVVVYGWSVQRTETLPSIRRPAADRGC